MWGRNGVAIDLEHRAEFVGVVAGDHGELRSAQQEIERDQALTGRRGRLSRTNWTDWSVDAARLASGRRGRSGPPSRTRAVAAIALPEGVALS